MFKRTVSLTAALAVVVALSPLAAIAGSGTSTTSTTKTNTAAKTSAREAKLLTTQEQSMPKPVANTIAVCACGKVFETSAKTPYIEYEGKTIACCSPECYQMALKDPKKVAAMAEANTAKVLGDVKAESTKTTKSSK